MSAFYFSVRRVAVGLAIGFMALPAQVVLAQGDYLCENELLQGVVIEGNVVVAPGSYCYLVGIGNPVVVKGNFTSDGGGNGGGDVAIFGDVTIEGNVEITNTFAPESGIGLLSGVKVFGNVTISDNTVFGVLVISNTEEGEFDETRIGKNLTIENNHTSVTVAVGEEGATLHVGKNITMNNNTAADDDSVTLKNTVAESVTFSNNSAGIEVDLINVSAFGNITYEGNVNTTGQPLLLHDNNVLGNFSCANNAPSINKLNNSVGRKDDCQ